MKSRAWSVQKNRRTVFDKFRGFFCYFILFFGVGACPQIKRNRLVGHIVIIRERAAVSPYYKTLFWQRSNISSCGRLGKIQVFCNRFNGNDRVGWDEKIQNILFLIVHYKFSPPLKSGNTVTVKRNRNNVLYAACDRKRFDMSQTFEFRVYRSRKNRPRFACAEFICILTQSGKRMQVK